MKRRGLLLILAALVLFCLPALADISIDETHFPDQAFRKLVSEKFDTNGNMTLSDAELSSVAALDCPSSGISSLRGIEYFPSLQSLNCSGNPLGDLDLRQNIALVEVKCFSCNLSYLLIDSSPSLQQLDCHNNDLSNLNLGGNPDLVTIYCQKNRLGRLDMSSHPGLIRADCSENELTELLLSGCSSLADLNCGNNNIYQLDVSSCPDLEILDCSNNNINGTVDFSGNPKLNQLDCSGNRLTHLSLSGNTRLERLSCQDNDLQMLDLQENDLYLLFCQRNSLVELALGRQPHLSELNCSFNRLPSLELTQCPNLRLLRCGNNVLSSLSLADNLGLRELQCQRNQVTELNLSMNTQLETCYCFGNRLSSLDISRTSLTALEAYDNYLMDLDISVFALYYEDRRKHTADGYDSIFDTREDKYMLLDPFVKLTPDYGGHLNEFLSDKEHKYTVYSVQIVVEGPGRAYAVPGVALPGEDVRLVAEPDSGYRLAGWDVLEGGVALSGNVISMGSKNVRLRAVFVPEDAD